MTSKVERVPSSYKDPSGYLFRKDGVLYRRVLKSYAEDYELAQSSGLYRTLVDKQYLVEHKELSADSNDTYKIIQPQEIRFISYPYEWSFAQLKDAALLTLFIQEHALQHGMTLKDASAFNVAFRAGEPIFLDSLSFERLKEGPWIAYGQFCRHFLAPLLLMRHCDHRLTKLLSSYLDGVPIDMTSKLLPLRTYFSLATLLHVHIHAKTIKKHAATKESIKRTLDVRQQQQLITHLQKFISSLSISNEGVNSHWSNYYQVNNYTSDQQSEKIDLCKTYLEELKPSLVWDLGCNTGWVSGISAEMNIDTVAVDDDHECVQQLYLNCKGKGLPIYPLLIDLSNPSAGYGWAGTERESFEKRGPADLVFALALIHHLVIANNVPLNNVAQWLRSITKNHLIIEFVPKDDSQVKKMLLNRADIFKDYSKSAFEAAFLQFFEIEKVHTIKDFGRIIYVMKGK